MRIKSWVKYFGFAVLMLLIIILREYVIKQANDEFRIMFRLNFNLLFISMIITVGIGLLLGLEHIINETKKEGTFKINLPRIILIGLPSLYISCSNFLLWSGNHFVQKILAYPFLKLITYGTSYITIFQVVLGYIVITSFYKDGKKISKNHR